MPRSSNSVASDVTNNMLRQRVLLEAGMTEDDFDSSVRGSTYLLAVIILGVGAGYACYHLKH